MNANAIGKWTPGPWRRIPDFSYHNAGIATFRENTSWQVASINPARDEWRANAMLIAAAPALAEALRELVRNINDGESPRLDAALKALKAAGVALSPMRG